MGCQFGVSRLLLGVNFWSMDFLGIIEGPRDFFWF